MPQTGQCLQREGRQMPAWEVPKLLGLWSSGEPRFFVGGPHGIQRKGKRVDASISSVGGSLTYHGGGGGWCPVGTRSSTQLTSGCLPPRTWDCSHHDAAPPLPLGFPPPKGKDTQTNKLKCPGRWAVIHLIKTKTTLSSRRQSPPGQAIANSTFLHSSWTPHDHPSFSS